MSSIQRCHKYFQFPLAIIVFNRILLYADDPGTMESILTAPECLNKTFLQNGFYANKGLLHAKDEQWKIRRKQLNPAFSHNTLVSFFDVFNRVANELRLKISEDLQGNKVNFKSLEDLITRAVLEVSCLTTMGYETNFLKHDSKGIAKAYRYLMELTALRILRPWYQIDLIFRLLDYKNYEKSKRANKLVKEFVANIVQEKHIEWQVKNRLQPQLQHQKPDIRSTTSNCATSTNKAKDELPLNEQGENHNFTGNTDAVANEALKNMVEKHLALPNIDTNTNANAFMQQQQEQQQRIFIDQIFYLAQTGKLTLEDIINESQSMVVVSFETVSSCIINALLCLAINHECQVKLRQEIKQTLLQSSLSKDNIKNKTKMTTASITIPSIKRNHDIATSRNEGCTNTIDDDLVCNTTANVNCKSAENKTGSSEYNDYGEDDSRDGDDVQVTMEDLLNMPYLDMIINESLRLLTTVPMNLRNVSLDFQLNVIQRDKCSCSMKTSSSNNNRFHCSSCQRCVVVPKDTMIALDTFNMQRNELYWGKNALKFYPEYFAKKPQQQKNQTRKSNGGNVHETPVSSTTTASTNRHSYAFIPFSKGLRTCIGYRYSIYLSKIVLIKLISSFEFSTNIQLQDLECYEGVSLKFRNAEKIHFQIHPVG